MNLWQAFAFAHLLTVNPLLHHTEVFTVNSGDAAPTSAWQAQAELFDQNIYPRLIDFLYSNQKAVIPEVSLFFSPNLRGELYKGWEDAEFWNHYHQNVIAIADDLDGASFSVVAIHEMQHLFNEISKRESGTREEKWLDEGLSELLEWRMTGLFPSKLVDSVFLSGEIENLSKWPDEETSPQKNYGQSFLFIYYLYQHFGQDAFLRAEILNPTAGWAGLIATLKNLNPEADPNSLAPENLFLSFSLSLAVNSKIAGIHRQYSISGPAFENELNNRKISARFFSTQSKNEKLKPLSARFYRLDVSGCVVIPAVPGVQVFLATFPLAGAVTIREIKKEESICAPENSALSTELILVNDSIKL
jgi:hypothetical protein